MAMERILVLKEFGMTLSEYVGHLGAYILHMFDPIG